MRKQRQLIDHARRMPKQSRALDTVETIFEATARILQRGDRRALNTNAIAERAGISVGTLYQYFPNKETILVAMARRRLQADQAAVIDAISAARHEPDATLARRVIRALIDVHRERPTVRRAIMAAHVAQGLWREHVQPLQDVADLLAARDGGLSPARLFVITRAVAAVIRAALQEKSPLLSAEEFEDELVRLVEEYLSPSRER